MPVDEAALASTTVAAADRVELRIRTSFPVDRKNALACGDGARVGTRAVARGASMQTVGSKRGFAKRDFAPWADRDAAPLLRIEGLSKRFGAFAAVDRAVARHLSGRVLRAARSVGLRQDHAVAPDRRLRAAECRPHPARRRRPRAGAAASASGQHDVPELCAVPASHRRGQRRLRPQAGGLAEARNRRARRRHAGAGQARKFRPAQAARAVRRPAPARGAGAFAGQAPARAAARRADGGARQEAARRDAVRADGAAAPARADFHHRHPRPERSHDGRRPHRA